MLLWSPGYSTALPIDIRLVKIKDFKTVSENVLTVTELRLHSLFYTHCDYLQDINLLTQLEV